MSLARIIAVASFAFGTSLAIAQSPAAQPTLNATEQQCFSLVKGKVAYDTQGGLIQRDSTVLSLCRGTTDPAATIACFTSAMQANNQWQTAITACKPPAGGSAPFSVVGAQAVNQVEYGMEGQKLGVYRMVKPGQWLEIHVDGTAGFQFNEARRDNADVYLVDPSRGANIQLDLAKHHVLYSDGDAPTPRLLYNIRAASGPPGIQPGAVSAKPPSTPLLRPNNSAGMRPSSDSQPPTGALTGNGQIDSSFAVLRCGAVADAPDANNKCAAACSNYGGFSGNWTVAVQPNLAVCQCKARLDPKMKGNEVIASHIRTNDDAAKVCPAACQYYSGGDGTWRDLNASHSVCGCTDALH